MTLMVSLEHIFDLGIQYPSVVLVIVSVLAGIIILLKLWQFSSVKSSPSTSWAQFMESSDLVTARHISKRLDGQLASIARTGFDLLESVGNQSTSLLREADFRECLLERALNKEIMRRVSLLKAGLTLLLVIGSASVAVPFILLVWSIGPGVIKAYTGIDIPIIYIGQIDAFLGTELLGIVIGAGILGAYVGFLQKAKTARERMEVFAADFVLISRENQFKYGEELSSDPVQMHFIPAEENNADAKHSYGQILKSSAMVGGSSVVNIAIGIVRTKAMAVLLGPSGIGLMGLYASIAELAQSIAGMGVNSSGVRQIAEAVGSNDQGQVARTAAVLRRTSIFLGLTGAAVLLGCSRQISFITFGSEERASGIGLLALAVFFQIVSDGQSALINGMRRIGDLARMKILGGLFGAITSIPLVYFFHEEGVVPSLITVSAMALVTSWWYRRKITIQSPSMSRRQLSEEQIALLKLGFAFMSSGIMMMGVSYAVRLLILRQVGVEAAGLYQSAWGLGGMYVGIVLQAMGADFYPRLTAVAKDNRECNRLVNEQALVSMLLAGPGVIATLTFAPLALLIFYTPNFYGAIELLRWLCLGMALRILSWPMGFIIVAKGAQNLFFWSEAAWTVVYASLAWSCVKSFGLNGAGIAFFGSYIFHCFLIYAVVRHLSDFSWSDASRKASLIFLGLILAVFCGFYILPPVVAIIVGTVALVISCVYAVRTILRLVPLDRVPRQIMRLFCWLRISSFPPR